MLAFWVILSQAHLLAILYFLLRFLFLRKRFGPWLLLPSSDALLNHEVPGKIPLVCRKDWKTTSSLDSQRTPQSTSTSKRNTEQLRTVFGSSRIVTLSCSRTVFDRSDNGLCILHCLENPALQSSDIIGSGTEQLKWNYAARFQRSSISSFSPMVFDKYVLCV